MRCPTRIVSSNAWFSAVGKPKRGKGRHPCPFVDHDLCSVAGQTAR